MRARLWPMGAGQRWVSHGHAETFCAGVGGAASTKPAAPVALTFGQSSGQRRRPRCGMPPRPRPAAQSISAPASSAPRIGKLRLQEASRGLGRQCGLEPVPSPPSRASVSDLRTIMPPAPARKGRGRAPRTVVGKYFKTHTRGAADLGASCQGHAEREASLRAGASSRPPPGPGL